ncbi:MAG: GAP family protein, partial [Oscillospiraceae bacterium]|nr:GAP family protein [Oscillospiraceae bacterium]
RRINKKFSEILSAHIEKCEPEEKKDPGSNIKSVAPLALVMLGMFAVLCEIPTSLPYFAFLAALLQFELSFPILLGVLVLYNFLFTLPLYLMYILYLKCKKKVDRLYHFLNDRLFRYGTILLPVLAAIIGVGLILHAGYTLYFC